MKRNLPTALKILAETWIKKKNKVKVDKMETKGMKIKEKFLLPPIKPLET